jgi:uncharacterized protein
MRGLKEGTCGTAEPRRLRHRAKPGSDQFRKERSKALNQYQDESSPTGVFGKLKVRLDPWQPEFGPEFAGIEEQLPESPESLDIELERSPQSWGGIDPDVRAEPREPVWFIDGVRRLEARVIAKLNDQYSYGAFGAYAVGAVQVNSEQALFERFLTGRMLALSSPEQPIGEIAIARGLIYLPVRVADAEPDAPTRAIHGEMRKAEEALARELASSEGRLVVVDGPLTFEEPTRGSAVGYIKRVIKTYLAPPQLALLAVLKPGQRTPLFALRRSKRFSRISWFLRLSEPRKGDSEFSGIVRLEVAEPVGVEGAKNLADACGAFLPELKARRALDQRAPQNLLPISALERFLRRKLGDERIIRRRLESFLAREAD